MKGLLLSVAMVLGFLAFSPQAPAKETPIYPLLATYAALNAKFSTSCLLTNECCSSVGFLIFKKKSCCTC